MNIPPLRGGPGIDILFSPGMPVTWSQIDVGGEPNEPATGEADDSYEDPYEALGATASPAVTRPPGGPRSSRRHRPPEQVSLCTVEPQFAHGEELRSRLTPSATSGGRAPGRTRGAPWRRRGPRGAAGSPNGRPSAR